MANVNALIQKRLQKGELSPKMAAMAERSANGNLTSFAGLFSVSELNDAEKHSLKELLQEYKGAASKDIEHDFQQLVSITSEVKAINNQAAILHGERIKKAHAILIQYKDGAFTAWLIAAYGNRQTPYNLMQYYDFYMAMPAPLKPKIEAMPKQAVYTLAARDAPLDKKKKFVENFAGETKNALLAQIRETFPLKEEDRRRFNAGDAAIQAFAKGLEHLESQRSRLSASQKTQLGAQLDQLKKILRTLLAW